jgi:hypothetical protein
VRAWAEHTKRLKPATLPPRRPPETLTSSQRRSNRASRNQQRATRALARGANANAIDTGDRDLLDDAGLEPPAITPRLHVVWVFEANVAASLAHDGLAGFLQRDD